MAAGQMAAHLEHDGRCGQGEADPEPPRHVREFGIRRIVQRDQIRFERHAADRAASRTDLADLRMHRAGVYGALGRRSSRRAGRRLLQVSLRVCGELASAARRAEVMGLAGDCEPMRGLVRIDGHSADGIDRAGGGAVGMFPMGVMAVMGVASPAAAAGRAGFRRSRFLLRAAPATTRAVLLRIRHDILQRDENPYPVGVYEPVRRQNQGDRERRSSRYGPLQHGASLLHACDEFRRWRKPGDRGIVRTSIRAGLRHLQPVPSRGIMAVCARTSRHR
jgi:hypothetical protein